MASVCILHMGGTIGMVRDEAGHYAPEPRILRRFLEGISAEISAPDLPSFDLHVVEPLLDSADTGPVDWLRVASMIVEQYDRYDGFVVVHGTDTMAYTASALSFLLPGLSKPVVLTGSQLSLNHPRTDGGEHMVTALMIAGSMPVPEVSIYFAGRLWRGNRAQKVHNDDYLAFSSGNFPPLARVGVSIDLSTRLIRAAGPGVPKSIELPETPNVVSLRLFPGLSPELLDRVLLDADALVLETYGAGNAPTRDPRFVDILGDAVERGVVVVNCSQCHGGAVRQNLYSTGARLTEAGVVPGHDMTPEAALTKLYCLLGAGHSVERVRADVCRNLVGELTE